VYGHVAGYQRIDVAHLPQHFPCVHEDNHVATVFRKAIFMCYHHNMSCLLPLNLNHNIPVLLIATQTSTPWSIFWIKCWRRFHQTTWCEAAYKRRATIAHTFAVPPDNWPGISMLGWRILTAFPSNALPFSSASFLGVFKRNAKLVLALGFFQMTKFVEIG